MDMKSVGHLQLHSTLFLVKLAPLFMVTDHRVGFTCVLLWSELRMEILLFLQRSPFLKI